MKKQNPQEHYTAYQLKLPVEIEKIIEISDPVYSYSEVMDHIDDRIFADVNEYIFQKEQVDLNHVYIDGTKITANVGKYSRVWKKSCEKNRIKLFAKITELLENMNDGAALLGVKFDIREEYAIEYLEEILKKYIELVGFDPGKAVHGKGNHKTSEQRLVEKFSEYIERLKKYAGMTATVTPKPTMTQHS